MNWLIKLLGGGILQPIREMLGMFFGNRESVEGAIANEQRDASEAYQSEFQFRGQRFWFDSLVDGLNRLPRPVIAIGVFALMVYAPLDPVRFSIIMQAYTLVPEWLALVFAQILLLYFGGRMLDKWPGKMTSVSPADVKNVLSNINALHQMVQGGGGQLPAPAAPPVDMRPDSEAGRTTLPQDMSKPVEPDAAYQADMADTSTPLTNASIAEWNRRRQYNQAQQ